MQNAIKNGAKSIGDYKEEEDKWSGSGFRLGNDQNDSLKLPSKKNNEKVRKVITFYKGGIFTVDDGEPRNMNEEKNQALIDDINGGLIPYEFEQEFPGREVHVDLIDKKYEEYKESPKPKIIAFSGSGHSLGGTNNNNFSNTSLDIEPREIVLDTTQKTTSIRVTLHNGSKIVVKLNLTHTIRDLYSHVYAKHPESKSFELKLTYPVQTLSELDKTIAEANLMSSSITQFLV